MSPQPSILANPLTNRGTAFTHEESSEDTPAGTALVVRSSGTDAALAADLITFSRVAGVLVPQDDRQVPLVPVPRLRYIDGTESQLGSTGSCNFL